MKALTICQPYAELILRGEKRVENRTWPTSYRGRMYVHAGKSREWWDAETDAKRFPNAAWGAVVAIATLADCINHGDLFGPHRKWDEKYPWLREHAHTFGPWCWVLTDVTPIGPWPWRGAQGLFEINEAELGRVANRELRVSVNGGSGQ